MPARRSAAALPARFREIEVPPEAAGMRLDRFLALWFETWTRSALARGIRRGLVTDAAGRRLRASHGVRGGERVRIYVPGIAPVGDPPPFPPILHEDDHIVVVDKPAGLLAHPSGDDWTWAVVSLAKARWPDRVVNLAHRLDRDTSGVLAITLTAEANRFLKAASKRGGATKEYEAIVRGVVPWDRRELEGPIGPAEGPIRIQMAVRPDGLSAHTTVEVVERHTTVPWTRVRCRIRSGRTHQIRVHLAHVGFPILGDRLYGVPIEVATRAWDTGALDDVLRSAGAPRQALHAARIVLPHPRGDTLDVSAPPPPDMTAWWGEGRALPHEKDPG